jgi:hypothetical protein
MYRGRRANTGRQALCSTLNRDHSGYVAWKIPDSLSGQSALLGDCRMNRKVLRLIVAVAMFGPLPATATTYNYSGPLYTTNNDLADYGLRMTGSVTFNFDTSGVTGTFPYFVGGSITNLQLTSGNVTISAVPCAAVGPSVGCIYDVNHNPIGFGEVFVLTGGAITSWLVQTSSGSTSMAASGSGSGPDGFGNCGVVPCSGIVVSNNQNFITNNSTELAEELGSRGVWSVDTANTPLPAALPLFATGLGALGLIGWRRTRKALAA